MTEMLASLLAVLEEQERRLVFTKFNNVTAWDLGVRILVVAAIEDFLNNAEQAQGSKAGGGAD